MLSFIGNLPLILVSEIWVLLRLCLRVTQRPLRLGFFSPFMAFKNFAMKSLPWKCLLFCLGAKFFLLISVTYKCVIEVIYAGILSVKEKGSLQVWWGDKSPVVFKKLSHVLPVQHQLMWEGVKSSPISVPFEKSCPSGLSVPSWQAATEWRHLKGLSNS